MATTLETPDIKAMTLRERLHAILGEVEDIDPSSKNEFNKPAIGVTDVMKLLRPLFFKYRVLPMWEYEEAAPEHGKAGGVVQLGQRLVQGSYVVRLMNVDVNDGTDDISCPWTDYGSNPSAASSFARKTFYKALFHLAEETDDAINHDQQPRTRAQAPARVQSDEKPVATCPECKTGLKVITKADKSFVGHVQFPTDCQYKVPWAEQRMLISGLTTGEPQPSVDGQGGLELLMEKNGTLDYPSAMEIVKALPRPRLVQYLRDNFKKDGELARKLCERIGIEPTAAAINAASDEIVIQLTSEAWEMLHPDQAMIPA